MFFFKIRLVLYRLWITLTKDKFRILGTEDVEISVYGNFGLTLDKVKEEKCTNHVSAGRPKHQ